jgi:hypothetical protein
VLSLDRGRTKVVALADRNAFHPQDIVSGRGVEKEVGIAEAEQEILRGKAHPYGAAQNEIEIVFGLRFQLIDSDTRDEIARYI